MRYYFSLNKWDFSIKELGYKTSVTVPHTWNVDDAVMKYRGQAEYETSFFIENELKSKRAQLYFGAVYHSAKIYVNDIFAGEHNRSGFTPFELDITKQIYFGADNKIRVVVDNTHIEEMLPHKDDFDWADDGGIIRKVRLQFMEPDAISFLHIEEEIDKIEGELCSGSLIIKTAFANGKAKDGIIRIISCADNSVVLEKQFFDIEDKVRLEFENLKLWSCFSPNLYRISLETDGDFYEIRTGLRTIKVENGAILLNGKEIYLNGCEWMPGSHPDFGMAEPLWHSINCLKQLKDAGCVFTRFHWQQDDSLFDWCDENGLLVQEEIPYWGYPKQAGPLQLEIAKQQAEEMVQYHKNHPSILFWGVGNELGAETTPTIDYIKEMSSYFKSLDTRRLVNYVSNTLSLEKNAQKEDGTLYGDIAMWNDYLGFWEPSSNIKEHAIKTAAKCGSMPLVISEFGLCEPYFKGGDERRAEILKSRLELYREISNIKGYMWFSLNDYRTHVGEQSEDKLRRRVHGSTDLYGNEKPSYRLFCKLQRERFFILDKK